MPSFNLRSSCVVWLGLCLVAAGCGNSGPTADVYDTVTAAGTVTYKNQPLEGYQVSFLQEGKRAAIGVTDKDGKFVLGTNDPGDGAPPGKHKVTVVFVPVTPDAASATPEEVAKGASKPKVKIPKQYENRDKTPLEIEVPEGGSSELKVELTD